MIEKRGKIKNPCQLAQLGERRIGSGHKLGWKLVQLGEGHMTKTWPKRCRQRSAWLANAQRGSLVTETG